MFLTKQGVIVLKKFVNKLYLNRILFGFSYPD